MRKITKALALGATVLLFTACGGSGGGGTQSSTTANSNGLWVGTQTVDGTTFDTQYLIYNKEIVGYSIQGGVLFSGIGSTNGDNFTASYNLFDADTGNSVGSGDASGKIIEQSSISGTFTNSSGQSGTLNLSYENQYNNPSSIDYIANTYNLSTGTFTISSTGQISGKVNGCDVSGNISTPDSNLNVYNIDYTLSSCSYAGNYSGLGTIVYYPDSATYIFQAGMSNGSQMTLFVVPVPKPSTF